MTSLLTGKVMFYVRDMSKSTGFSHLLPLPKRPSYSYLSCLSFSPQSAPCLHPHYCEATSIFMSTPATGLLLLIFCLCWTTHTRGHMLDLMCSVGTTPTSLQCLDLAVCCCLWAARRWRRGSTSYTNVGCDTPEWAGSFYPHAWQWTSVLVNV